MTSAVNEFYGNRLRLRVCGLCVVNDELLMVNHHLHSNVDLWIPPGGGVAFGESVTEALKREFLEETGLIIKVEELLFTCELIQPPLHAVELFFKVTKTGGTLHTGYDPELVESVIKEVRFVGWDVLASIHPDHLHGIFRKVSDPIQIMSLRGYIKL